MAGSKRYFAYFDDSGTEWSVQLDESVAESLDLGFGQAITPAVASNLQSRMKVSSKVPIEMRYVLCSRLDNDDREVKRKFYVGSTTAPIWNGTDEEYAIDGLTWAVTARIGEKRYYFPRLDTGLIDGDIDANFAGALPE